MTHPAMDEALGRIAAAHLEAADALHRLVEAINGRGGTARLSEAEPEPAAEPAPGEWRNDRLLDEYDSPSSDPRVYQWDATRGVYAVARWDVKPGQWWASGRLEKPTSPPPPLLAQPALTGWITDRVPEEGDGDATGWVKIPDLSRLTSIHCFHIETKYWKVHPGTPWAPLKAKTAPWDPTTLDRNGWIRSRLPTEGDAHREGGCVWIPCNASSHTWQHYTFVTPGQPWAPWDSKPGPYQP